MNPQRTPQQLSKMLVYILERRPDEFGLILAEDGFVKIKDLLKALNEEPEYRWVRQTDIDNILYVLPDSPVEIRENLIRAKNREKLPGRSPAYHLPKLLFTCVRNRAYPHVLKEGVFTGATDQVILSSDREMAKRMGKRIDSTPVLLIIMVSESISRGVTFLQFGETLFLTDGIPTGCFSGPPLPKEKPEAAPKEVRIKPRDPSPGSFYLNLEPKKEEKNRSKRKKEKEISRKRDRDRKRKNRESLW